MAGDAKTTMRDGDEFCLFIQLLIYIIIMLVSSLVQSKVIEEGLYRDRL